MTAPSAAPGTNPFTSGDQASFSFGRGDHSPESRLRFKHSLTGMILINSASSALGLLVIPFLPRALIASRGGEAQA